ncbi:MAG: OmpA family protein [Spirochaetota bacterium]
MKLFIALYTIAIVAGTPAYTQLSGNIIERKAAARGMLVDVKNAMKRKDYEKARAYIIKAYEVMPNDSEIKKNYFLLAAPVMRIETESEIFYYSKTKECPLSVRVVDAGAGTQWVKSFKLEIADENGQTIRTIITNSAPDKISWNGMNDNGTRVADGQYILRAFITGELGFSVPVTENRILALGKELAVAIAIKETLFPAGKTTVAIQTFYPDRSRMASWTLSVVNNSGRVVRSMKGANGLPSVITWDGRDDNGDVVPGGDIFSVSLIGMDNGKKQESNRDTIESEIEIITVGDTLTFKMSTLQFDVGKAAVQPKSFILLDRVAAILKKYSWYSVLIEGHTDDVGADDKNMTLSKERAEAVRDYLLKKHSLSAGRFTVSGMGKTKPVVPNTSEANRAKNRRVEFILTETKEK